jgi:hypothetical protein
MLPTSVTEISANVASCEPGATISRKSPDVKDTGDANENVPVVLDAAKVIVPIEVPFFLIIRTELPVEATPDLQTLPVRFAGKVNARGDTKRTKYELASGLPVQNPPTS